MPVWLPTAVKARHTLVEKELNVQEAVNEFWATQDDIEPPSQSAIAAKHCIPLSTLTAHIRGCPSKLASASQQLKILPNEELLVVDYLEEAVHQGFPDTKSRCI
jgi:hypothetical protein